MSEGAIAIHEQEEIDEIRTGIGLLTDKVHDLRVFDAASVAVGTDVLGLILARKKRVEAMRVSLVKPLNDHVLFINAGVRPLAVELARLEGVVKKDILDYTAEVERLAREEHRRKVEEARVKAEAEAEEARKTAEAEAIEAGFTEEESTELAELEAEAVKDESPIILPPVPVTTIETPRSKATVRKVWTFEVENINKVPAVYLLLDPKAVNGAIREGVREIKGLRIFQRSILSGGRS
jgi:hypothetical protein